MRDGFQSSLIFTLRCWQQDDGIWRADIGYRGRRSDSYVGDTMEKAKANALLEFSVVLTMADLTTALNDKRFFKWKVLDK